MVNGTINSRINVTQLQKLNIKREFNESDLFMFVKTKSTSKTIITARLGKVSIATHSFKIASLKVETIVLKYISLSVSVGVALIISTLSENVKFEEKFFCQIFKSPEL